MAPLTLPHILQRRIEALAVHLLAPAGMPPFDFTTPRGEPALIPAESVSWRVFANPATLFIGGVAAVLLELAEPRVRAGVWEHSSFRTEPLARLQRTGLAAMVTVYGAESRARAMIEGVNRLHTRIAGITGAGAPYRADDPELLDWVQATALWGFLEAYHVYARPLSHGERDSCFAAGVPAAALYGATGAPGSEAEWQDLLARTAPSLEPSATLQEFLAIMRRVPALPRLGRPAQLLLVKAAADILPRPLAERLGLAEWRLKAWERPLVSAMAGAAERLLIRSWPSVQARRRLSWPEIGPAA
jgi:uncharacterized protein (DUF2236 family)